MAEQSLKLFNTLSGQLEAFTPLDPAGKQVRFYVCGPTVYDDAHLGHARCYITWDVLYRFLKFMGYDVKYVRNVTDVDDKILNRAKERGEAPSELAERNYKSFSEDMAALNVLPPDEEPRATQYISQMLDGIKTLIEKGAAYAAADGSVYFRVSAKSDYGKLSKKPLDDLKAGARVEVDPNKESPLDFALWKAVPLTDVNGWESPWPATGERKGWGRPGWHMECSAMNHAVFGEQIDIHAGGADLIFPHHENEIAQSEAWSGKQPFSKYWLHNGFVNVSGEKMSKSLGNFSTIKKLLTQYDTNTIRYFLLTNGYRMPVDFNEEALQSAKEWVIRTGRKLRSLKTELGINDAELQAMSSSKTAKSEFYDEFKASMQHDLNTPKALATLNKALKKHDRASFEAVCILLDTLGFTLTQALIKSVMSNLSMSDSVSESVEYTATVESNLPLNDSVSDRIEIKNLLESRKQAKAAKDWSTADAIRDQIKGMGLQILDNKDGTTTVEKDGVELVRA